MHAIVKKGWAAALALAAAGCVSTPARRIERNPELFAGFPPEVQAGVREGRIEIGYTAPMVGLALGEPRRKVLRETEAGRREIWVYTRVTSRPMGAELIPVRQYVRGRSGAVYSVPDVVWVDRDAWVEEPYLRVEFVDGKVSAIESSGDRNR